MGFRRRSMNGSMALCPRLKRSIALVVATGFVAFHSLTAQAQVGGGFFNNRVVGGVSIRTDGVLQTATVEEQSEALALLREKVLGPQGDLKQSSNLRLISLKNLKKAILQSIEQNKPLPEEALFLGGITRIENVFVYPDRQDIVLAGPSEPWTVAANGAIVGTKSGRPVLNLDDLLCAFKTVINARTSGISVSIEPTPEGIVSLEKLQQQFRKNNVTNVKSMEPAMKEAFGPQQIKLEGLAADSHMAMVILAADYRMKLYGMNLAKAPVSGLPSYIEMISNQSNPGQLQSRWWMACDYSAIEHSADRMAWKISGPGIKTLTEQEQIAADGSVKQTGKTDRMAKKWADLFTEKLDVLATKDTVFGELRNVMDLCVVAALIESQELQGLSGCDLSSIMGESAKVELAKFAVPTSLDPQCSFIQTIKGWIVTTSGGVMVDSWQTVSHLKVNEAVATPLDSGASWKNDGQIWQ